MSKPSVLDPCCGSRMFYFDKNDPRVFFGDIRSESHVLCDGRALEVNPQAILDFRALPFADEEFKVVIFDPPHLIRAGKTGWVFKKYGALTSTWREDIAAGFTECFRVLSADGVLIFKWNEDQIPVSQILALTPHKPLIGHKSGKRSNTHWLTFMKESAS